MADRQPLRGNAPDRSYFGGASAQPRPGGRPPRLEARTGVQNAKPYNALLGQLDRSAAAKRLGGFVARRFGNLEGAVRETADSIDFLAHLADPFDSLKPPEEAAWGQLLSGVHQGVNRIVTSPRGALADMGETANHLFRSTFPGATPLAESFQGELRRSHVIGVDQGTAITTIAGLAAGGSGLLKLRAARPVVRAARAKKLVAKGVPPDVAAYLSKPYEGMGSHNVSRDFARRHGIPPWLADSPLNVQTLPGASQGSFYEHHYTVDPSMHGAKLPNGLSEKGWSGRRLGLEKYDRVESVFRRTPLALKATAAGLAYDTLGQEPSR